jgi:hypothetical protein
MPRSTVVGHVTPCRRGPTEAANLALSCNLCNAFKGPNLTSVDPETGDIVSLFHPRNDPWNDHFFFATVR